MTDKPLDWLRPGYLGDREQFVKMGHHQSDRVQLDVGVPRGSVYGPLLFAIYCSPVADVISQHCVKYHLSMQADNTTEGLAVLVAYVPLTGRLKMRHMKQRHSSKSRGGIARKETTPPKCSGGNCEKWKLQHKNVGVEMRKREITTQCCMGGKCGTGRYG